GAVHERTRRDHRLHPCARAATAFERFAGTFRGQCVQLLQFHATSFRVFIRDVDRLFSIAPRTTRMDAVLRGGSLDILAPSPVSPPRGIISGESRARPMM